MQLVDTVPAMPLVAVCPMLSKNSTCHAIGRSAAYAEQKQYLSCNWSLCGLCSAETVPVMPLVALWPMLSRSSTCHAIGRSMAYDDQKQYLSCHWSLCGI